MGISHAIIGATATSLVLQTSDLGLCVAGAIASLLPDIDSSKSEMGRILPWVARWFERRMPHRSCTHSLVASGSVAGVAYLLAIWAGLPWGFAHAVTIGYFVGWYADSFTKAGVEMFYPSSARWVVPGNQHFRLQSNSPAEYGILVILVALLAFSCNINAAGGVMTQFNKLIASTGGVEEVLDQKGQSHLIIAHIEGVHASDRVQMRGDYQIIQHHGQGFIVQDKEGLIYKAGTEPDVQIRTKKITADPGPTATTALEAVRLNDEEVASALRPFVRPGAMVFVSGQLVIRYPEDYNAVLDPRQFPVIVATGSNVFLQSAPIITVWQALGSQYATGQLTIRTIYAKTPTTSSSQP